MGYLPPGSRHNEAFRQSIPSSLDVREHFVTTSDKKRLHGFLVSKKQTQLLTGAEEPSKSAPVMIYFQGNAGNMSDRFGFFKTSIAAIPNLQIVGIAYRQYGNSEGFATEAGLKRDAKAILEAVKDMYGPEAPLYLYGHSLGGAVAIDLAASEPNAIRGVIIENTFTSIYGMVCALYPKYSPYPFIAKYCLWNHWRSDLRILKLLPTMRLLFLSSDQDEIVPSLHMKHLYAMARRAHIQSATLVSFKRSLHMDIYSTETRLFQTSLRRFIKSE
ncbi:hypothetical protein [Absidia glauca]|uniref:Serine aminopeptidase S33 domain-containing protein n=1 Tax=Absidia glauca TaxID=4829 RepID=A0A168LV68_ABSGL|nr:hypothetical protein [Absidia glauca]